MVRRGAEAVHFVMSPLEPGQEVELQVDWTRRFDHMQQHTGGSDPEASNQCIGCEFHSGPSKQINTEGHYCSYLTFLIAN